MGKKPKSLRTLQRGLFPRHEINLWNMLLNSDFFPRHKSIYGYAPSPKAAWPSRGTKFAKHSRILLGAGLGNPQAASAASRLGASSSHGACLDTFSACPYVSVSLSKMLDDVKSTGR
jgi:hypothetical protein